MQLFSQIIGRRLFAAVLGLSMLSAGPAQAATIAGSKAKAGSKMVTASNVQSVIDYLATKGATVEKGESDVGNPMLTSTENLFDVYFDCDENHADCSAIQFRACYSDYPTVGMDKTNALSRDFFFAKSYIDTDGLACIELPVATGLGGISYEAMDHAYDAFSYFTENTDEEFGS